MGGWGGGHTDPHSCPRSSHPPEWIQSLERDRAELHVVTATIPLVGKVLGKQQTATTTMPIVDKALGNQQTATTTIPIVDKALGNQQTATTTIPIVDKALSKSKKP